MRWKNTFNRCCIYECCIYELTKEVLGEKHSDYLTSLNNLASDYSHLGDYQKALEINKRVLEIRKEIQGEKHPDYFTSLFNHAFYYSCKINL